MPVPVKNTRPSEEPSVKKYTNQQLERIMRDKLKEFCKRKNLPYCRLTKSQLIENILLWQDGKPYAYPELVRTYEEAQNAKHRITPQIRKFCLDYAACTKHKTYKQWGIQFGMSVATITNWLSLNEVKALIEVYQYSMEKRVTEIFAQNQEIAILELIQIMTNRRTNAEVRRKAISDLLGYAGRINVNIARTTISQSQGQGQGIQNNDYSKMSEKEIDEALKEMDDLDAD